MCAQLKIRLGNRTTNTDPPLAFVRVYIWSVQLGEREVEHGEASRHFGRFGFGLARMGASRRRLSDASADGVQVQSVRRHPGWRVITMLRVAWLLHTAVPFCGFHSHDERNRWALAPCLARAARA